MYDPDAEHQIRLAFVSGEIGVSCACLRRADDGRRAFLHIAPLVPAHEAQGIYRQHLTDAGAAV
jgi:hypothetical protein